MPARGRWCDKIEALGVQGASGQVDQGKSTATAASSGWSSPTATALDVDMIIVSAGIRPRDDLAKQARACRRRARRHRRRRPAAAPPIPTSSPSAKCASHGGMIYGLVAPGYEMAEIVAANLTGARPHVHGRRSVDQAQADGRRRRQLRRLRSCRAKRATPLVFEDPFAGVYKKLLFSPDGTRLLGGILVGDAADYGTLLDARQERHAAAVPAARTARRSASSSGAAMRRRRDARRRAGLLVQQRQQGADLRGDSRAGARHGRRGQAVHQGRHRLRRLRAAGDRPVQGRAEDGRQGGRQPPLRALSATRGRSCSRS